MPEASANLGFASGRHSKEAMHGSFAIKEGRLAQLVRAPRLHRGGWGFESLVAHWNVLQDGFLVMSGGLLCRSLWHLSS